MNTNQNEKPWLAEYKVLGIPESLKPYPKVPSHNFLKLAAEKYRKMGYVQMGYEMSYPEAWDKAVRLANALQDLGVKKGDRVATMLPTSIQYVLADHAISIAGAVHVPLSFLEPPDHLEHKFDKSTPKAIFILQENLQLLDKIKEKYPVQNVIVSNISDYSSAPPARDPLPGMHWMVDLIDSHPAQAPAVEIDPERDLEILLFTGGTTGVPKGCMLSHGNITANAIQNSWSMGITNQLLIGNISVLVGLPFFHSYGHCIMHTMTHLGFKQLLAPDPRDSRGMVDMIKTHFPMLQMGVPTQFMKMLDEELKGIGIIGLSGSAPLRPEVQEQFEKKGAGALMEGYGLSEMSPVTHLNTSVLLRLFGGRTMVSLLSLTMRIPGYMRVLRAFISLLGYRLVGRIAHKLIPLLAKISQKLSKLRSEEKRATIGVIFPDTEVKVIDIDTGKELSYRELIEEKKVGEMLLDGPQRMLGYWPDPGTGFDKDGFIHTGDVVRVDDHGYFYIEDRTKDMIVVSGYKVYSKEVEDILFRHPAVDMAAILGIPDPERPGSERVKVFIQPKPEFKGKVTEAEIISYLAQKIAKYAVPKVVEFLDEIPLTEVYKVNKKLLRQREKQKAEAGRA